MEAATGDSELFSVTCDNCIKNADSNRLCKERWHRINCEYGVTHRYLCEICYKAFVCKRQRDWHSYSKHEDIDYNEDIYIGCLFSQVTTKGKLFFVLVGLFETDFVFLGPFKIKFNPGQNSQTYTAHIFNEEEEYYIELMENFFLISWGNNFHQEEYLKECGYLVDQDTIIIRERIVECIQNALQENDGMIHSNSYKNLDKRHYGIQIFPRTYTIFTHSERNDCKKVPTYFQGLNNGTGTVAFTAKGGESFLRTFYFSPITSNVTIEQYTINEQGFEWITNIEEHGKYAFSHFLEE
eukprot:TRINITY_DN1015_c0_g1_i13.p1 TRINITY_DN1015_c0_g1~~TRINITY_DN1015_c0_g1_i13.p1  ORF type:complete len:296 (-),score=26.82 TRINITY_DN1015_c0_g1_i13:812-1699(-)